MKTIQIGDLAKDKITGFEGIVDALAWYSSGTRQVRIQPRVLQEGKPQECIWFELPQVEIVEEQVLPSPRFGEPKFGLFRKVRDTITGYVGVVNSQCFFLHGCIRYGLIGTTLNRDGGITVEAFDEECLELVDPTPTPDPVIPKKGGPERLPKSSVTRI